MISPSDEVCVRRDGSDDADNDPSQSMTETEQRLVVYGVGALGMPALRAKGSEEALLRVSADCAAGGTDPLF